MYNTFETIFILFMWVPGLTFTLRICHPDDCILMIIIILDWLVNILYIVENKTDIMLAVFNKSKTKFWNFK